MLIPRPCISLHRLSPSRGEIDLFLKPLINCGKTSLRKYTPKEYTTVSSFVFTCFHICSIQTRVLLVWRINGILIVSVRIDIHVQRGKSNFNCFVFPSSLSNRLFYCYSAPRLFLLLFLPFHHLRLFLLFSFPCILVSL